MTILSHSAAGSIPSISLQNSPLQNYVQTSKKSFPNDTTSMIWMETDEERRPYDREIIIIVK